jgi:hypothetical protein
MEVRWSCLLQEVTGKQMKVKVLFSLAAVFALFVIAFILNIFRTRGPLATCRCGSILAAPSQSALLCGVAFSIKVPWISSPGIGQWLIQISQGLRVVSAVLRY